MQKVGPFGGKKARLGFFTKMRIGVRNAGGCLPVAGAIRHEIIPFS